MALSAPPLSLYVHFPWCVSKCPYCDFNSHTLRGELPVADYLQALLRDLDTQLAAVQDRRIVSVFMGGGTPSLFPPRAIGELLAGIRSRTPLADDAEITLEANPGTIECGRFADYRAAGINRVSLGAQSFAAPQLQKLGRIHQADDTYRAVEELHAAGLVNFNLDLMVGLPEQNNDAALADVETALSLQPAHISLYQLTLEPGTVFGALPPAGLPDDDAAADMHAQCQRRLESAGFARYEVSAYARPGRRSRHNLNYWSFGDYLGIGAGAHGKNSDVGSGRIERTAREREPRRYLAAAARAATKRVVEPGELPFEFMMNALRLTDGFEVRQFEGRTGLDWQTVQPRIAELQQRGLLRLGAQCWSATELGGAFLNDLVSAFLPDNQSRQDRKSSKAL